ncbi:MAG TPA: asparagine synthase (glutamine-hydrolyzing) [Gemmatimonadales bacterium]|nr:asparagine synthase (glutamine-hydrolyzing) [Gemmatimonadales bacterium]
MCGIFGFWASGAAGSRFDGVLLREGTARVAHRGPDGAGWVGWTADGQRREGVALGDQPLRVGLGHRRLAIVDLSDAGAQPMRGRGDTWISLNGEIYNYRELRTELGRLGHCFQTGSDTEVVLAAYEEWGVACLERFNGMWAFLLYDPARHRLFIARDRLGVKPLYYARAGDGLAFASEIPALLECPGVTAAISPEMLGTYLVDRRTDDTDQTMYRDIRELRPAHAALLDTRDGELRIWRFWGLPEAPDLELSDAQALDRFAELFEDAVRLRLHADVPVAVTLSGGVDSSALTLAASRVAGAGVCTYTSRFPSHPEIDESGYATAVTTACAAAPRFIEPPLSEVISQEPELTRHQALPYASLSLYVHRAILSAVRAEGVPVVLSGQGGDEVFLGYERYHCMAALAALPNAWRAGAGLWQGARRSRRSLGRMLATTAYFGAPRVQRLLRRERLREVVRPSWLSPPEAAPPAMVGHPRRQQAAEITALSLPPLLRYDDRTAGALGMETRLPFLDYRVVEFGYRLPLHHKIRAGWTKHLVRRYLDRHGLAAVAWRRGKLGFNAPHAEWTRALVAARGPLLSRQPIAKALLATDRPLEQLPLPAMWDMYNCLHLAHLLGWTLDAT